MVAFDTSGLTATGTHPRIAEVSVNLLLHDQLLKGFEHSFCLSQVEPQGFSAESLPFKAGKVETSGFFQGFVLYHDLHLKGHACLL